MLQAIKCDLPYDLILKADYTQHTGSCIRHQKYELGDIHEKYGFSETYCLENTTIHQLWWAEQDLDYDQIGTPLGIDVVTISSIQQPPGCVVPLHRDTFFQINQRYPSDTRLKVRANIYLEDWQPGHMIQYTEDENFWSTDTNWLAGAGWVWDSSVLHLSANAGMKNKHTLQVSGFIRE